MSIHNLNDLPCGQSAMPKRHVNGDWGKPDTFHRRLIPLPTIFGTGTKRKAKKRKRQSTGKVRHVHYDSIIR